MDTKLLLTVDEAADRLSIGRATLYRMISSGLIESVSIGRSRRVPVRALEQFVARQLAEQGKGVPTIERGAGHTLSPHVPKGEVPT
jgi:excisionase family DNA binding protein